MPFILFMQIKAAIFDFDGVLNDTEGIKFKVWQRITKEQGINIEKKFYIDNCCGKAAEDIVVILSKKYSFQGDPSAVAHRMKEETKPLLLREIRPIKENIQFLKESFRIFKKNVALATSQDKDILLPSLKELKIDQFFSVIVAGHEIKNMKPAPDIYLKACEKLNVKPKEAVVIEDSEAGVESAYNAGIGLIIATPGEFTRTQDFSKADVIVTKSKKLGKGQQKIFSSISHITHIL